MDRAETFKRSIPTSFDRENIASTHEFLFLDTLEDIYHTDPNNFRGSILIPPNEMQTCWDQITLDRSNVKRWVDLVGASTTSELVGRINKPQFSIVMLYSIQKHQQFCERSICREFTPLNRDSTKANMQNIAGAVSWYARNQVFEPLIEDYETRRRYADLHLRRYAVPNTNRTLNLSRLGFFIDFSTSQAIRRQSVPNLQTLGNTVRERKRRWDYRGRGEARWLWGVIVNMNKMFVGTSHTPIPAAYGVNGVGYGERFATRSDIYLHRILSKIDDKEWIGADGGLGAIMDLFFRDEDQLPDDQKKINPNPLVNPNGHFQIWTQTPNAGGGLNQHERDVNTAQLAIGLDICEKQIRLLKMIIYGVLQYPFSFNNPKFLSDLIHTGMMFVDWEMGLDFLNDNQENYVMNENEWTIFKNSINNGTYNYSFDEDLVDDSSSDSGSEEEAERTAYRQRLSTRQDLFLQGRTPQRQQRQRQQRQRSETPSPATPERRTSQAPTHHQIRMFAGTPSVPRVPVVQQQVSEGSGRGAPSGIDLEHYRLHPRRSGRNRRNQN